MEGMTMAPSMSNNATMVPFLHFTGGDYLLFEAWKPTSAGAIAGACIGLVCLAIFDRWVSAIRGFLDNHWRHKGLVLASRSLGHSGTSSPSPSNELSEKSIYLKSDKNQLVTPLTDHQATSTRSRTIPPFIAAHDLPRGIIHAGQALMVYVLMLAAMTFNAAYIISIVAGLGIGEAMFGRIGNGRSVGH